MAEITEGFARNIFMTAIAEGKAAELLIALFNGGSCTIDLGTRKLVIMEASQMQGMIEE